MAGNDDMTPILRVHNADDDLMDIYIHADLVRPLARMVLHSNGWTDEAIEDAVKNEDCGINAIREMSTGRIAAIPYNDLNLDAFEES